MGRGALGDGSRTSARLRSHERAARVVALRPSMAALRAHRAARSSIATRAARAGSRGRSCSRSRSSRSSRSSSARSSAPPCRRSIPASRTLAFVAVALWPWIMFSESDAARHGRGRRQRGPHPQGGAAERALRVRGGDRVLRDPPRRASSGVLVVLRVVGRERSTSRAFPSRSCCSFRTCCSRPASRSSSARCRRCVQGRRARRRASSSASSSTRRRSSIR